MEQPALQQKSAGRWTVELPRAITAVNELTDESGERFVDKQPAELVEMYKHVVLRLTGEAETLERLMPESTLPLLTADHYQPPESAVKAPPSREGHLWTVTMVFLTLMLCNQGVPVDGLSYLVNPHSERNLRTMETKTYLLLLYHTGNSHQWKTDLRARFKPLKVGSATKEFYSLVETALQIRVCQRQRATRDLKRLCKKRSSNRLKSAWTSLVTKNR